jgi:hypothetical protein
MKDDVRPGFLLEDVNGADFAHVKAGQAAGRPTFVLRNVKDFHAWEIRFTPDTHLGMAEQQEF